MMDTRPGSFRQENTLCRKKQMGLFDFKPLITVVLGTTEPLTPRWHLSKSGDVDLARFRSVPLEPSAERTVRTLNRALFFFSGLPS